MFVGIVFGVPKNNPNNQKPTYQYVYTAETAQEAGQLADTQADALRRGNNTLNYSVLVGELTHEVEQPVRRVVLTRIAK